MPVLKIQAPIRDVRKITFIGNSGWNLIWPKLYSEKRS